MRIITLFFMLALLLGLAQDLSAQEEGKKQFQAQGVSRPIYNAELSFSVPGVVYDIKVKAGQYVKKGDLLISLDSRAEDSRIQQLEHEVNNTIKIRTLETRIAQSLLDMERFLHAFRRNAATEMEYQHSKLNNDLNVLALEEERFRINQIHHSISEYKAVRDKMYILAPSDGFVEEVFVERGMAVDRNVPALRLVNINPLLVELTLPIEQAINLNIGDLVEVIQPDSEEILEGKIASIAKIAVLSSRTLKVRIHVANSTGMPAGLLVMVRFNKKS